MHMTSSQKTEHRTELHSNPCSAVISLGGITQPVSFSPSVHLCKMGYLSKRLLDFFCSGQRQRKLFENKRWGHQWWKWSHWPFCGSQLCRENSKCNEALVFRKQKSHVLSRVETQWISGVINTSFLQSCINYKATSAHLNNMHLWHERETFFKGPMPD